MVDLSFSFAGPCWLWTAGNQVSWHFVTLPAAQSEEIKFFNENLHGKKRGWGSVNVLATIGSTSWQTSIFPYTKRGAYLLPIKADVRKKEKIFANQTVAVSLKINV